MNTGLIKLEELQKVTHEVFGDNHTIINSEKLLGGAQKHVYKITCSNNFIFVLYIWHKTTSYFTESEISTSIFTSNSATLFELNNIFMKSNGINVPEMYYMDKSKKEFDFEFALVQYIYGYDIDTLINDYPERVKPALMSLGDSVRKMKSIKRETAGTLDNPLNEFSCKDYVYDDAQNSLDLLIQDYQPVINIKEQIISCLNILYKKCIDNSEYSFIHFELGPNHVIVDKNNISYLIDFEGAKYFDAEYEHSFMNFRFGENYKYLTVDGLDSDKMEYYAFCHYLGLLAGAYELSKSNYYDMDDINGMMSFGFERIKSYCDKYVK